MTYIFILLMSLPIFAANSDYATQKLDQIDLEVKQSQHAKYWHINYCYNKGSKCEFTGLCNKLSLNKNSKVLYSNPENEELPNFKLLAVSELIQRCRHSKTHQQGFMNTSETFKEMTKKMAQKDIELMKSIEKNNELGKMVKIKQSMLDRMLEKNEENVGIGMFTKEQAEKNLRQAETDAGVKLSEESFNKWAALFVFDFEAPVAKVEDQDPFQNTDLLLNEKMAGSKEKLQENQKKYQAAMNKAFKTFTETKTQIIEILNKRKNGQNDADLNNMIKRIETIKLAQPQSLSPMVLSFQGCGSPNAFYSPISHEFTLCPSILNMPRATLQAIIAHELGHSIDPCIASFPLQEISGTKKENPQQKQIDEYKKSAEKMGVFYFKAKLPDQSEKRYAAFDATVLKLSLDLDNFNSTPVMANVKLSQNPYTSVISCLKSKDSVAARMGDINIAKTAIQNKIKNLTESGANAENEDLVSLKSSLARMDVEWADRQACSFVSGGDGKSQIQEAFSDWISAEVMANEIKKAKTPAKAAQIAFESNGFFAALSCESFEPDINKKVRETLKQVGCTGPDSTFISDMNNMHEHEDPHPEANQRISKIFLSHPTISSTLECKVEANVKHCE